jgi:phospholipase C
MSDFWNAANTGNMPAVSFLKAPNYQTSLYIDPIDEQNYLVDTINRLQNLPGWNSMVIIVTWDDSDGWYDHVMPQIVSQSNDPEHDALVGRIGLCGHARTGEYQDRCGYGPRLPLGTENIVSALRVNNQLTVNAVNAAAENFRTSNSTIDSVTEFNTSAAKAWNSFLNTQRG